MPSDQRYLTEEEKRYAEAMGADALERQQKAVKRYCKHCGFELPAHKESCPKNRRARRRRTYGVDRD